MMMYRSLLDAIMRDFCHSIDPQARHERSVSEKKCITGINSVLKFLQVFFRHALIKRETRLIILIVLLKSTIFNSK